MKKTCGIVGRFWHLPKRKRILLFVTIILTIVLIASLPVLAWFVNHKKIASMVMVNAPTILTIGAGANDVSDMIDLSDIDVEQKGISNPTYYGEYVFAIRGKYLSAYDLQIARTTNIPFEYEVYRVSIVGDSGTLSKGYGTTDSESVETLSDTYHFAKYIATDGLTYYYPYINDTIVTGELLNPKNKVMFSGNDPVKIGNGITPLEDGTFHSHNYNSYDYVNEFAEPLYWQASNLTVNSVGKTDAGDFVDYYVLKLKWNDKFTNSKETDMIYITARRHN